MFFGYIVNYFVFEIIFRGLLNVSKWGFLMFLSLRLGVIRNVKVLI